MFTAKNFVFYANLDDHKRNITIPDYDIDFTAIKN